MSKYGNRTQLGICAGVCTKRPMDGTAYYTSERNDVAKGNTDDSIDTHHATHFDGKDRERWISSADSMSRKFRGHG